MSGLLASREQAPACLTPPCSPLKQRDNHSRDSAGESPLREEEKESRLRYFRELLDASGIAPKGSILDLASGSTSLASLYPGAIAVDNDPDKIKRLRRDHINGVVASIEELPFGEKSFDYVISISPPLKPVIQRRDGHVRFTIDREHSKKIVEAVLKLARVKALIASYDIAQHPPFEERLEKRATDGFYYVVYRPEQ